MENSNTNMEQYAEKSAVIEALYNYLAGLDLRDKNLIMAAFTENAVSDFRPAGKKAGFEYPVLEGRETIVAALTVSLSGIDTTHSVSNPRVTLSGNHAVLDALVEAQHVPAKDHSLHYLMKNRYDVEMVKQEDIWVIQRVTVDNIWRTGNPAVLSGI